MASRIELQRSGPAPFMPAPKAVKACDYVFTSSIYPIDKSGNAIGTEDRGETAPSTMELQARHCLDTLAAVLKEFGSSLDRVLKVDVHLVDPSDFVEFKHVRLRPGTTPTS